MIKLKMLNFFRAHTVKRLDNPERTSIIIKDTGNILDNFINLSSVNFLRNGFSEKDERKKRGNFFDIYLKYLKYLSTNKSDEHKSGFLDFNGKRFKLVRTRLFGVATIIPECIRLKCLYAAYLMGLSEDSFVDILYIEYDNDNDKLVLISSGSKKIYNYNQKDRDILFFPTCVPVKNFIILKKISNQGKSIDHLLPLGCTPSISSHFGVKDKLGKKSRKVAHSGIDLINSGNRHGSIMAMCDGVVEYAGLKKDGYGYKVILNHGKNKTEYVYTLYAHMDEIFVKVGDKIHIGDIIGRIGSTGMSTSPHLHLEFRIGNKRLDAELSKESKNICVQNETTPKELSIRLKLFKLITDIIYQSFIKNMFKA